MKGRDSVHQMSTRGQEKSKTAQMNGQFYDVRDQLEMKSLLDEETELSLEEVPLDKEGINPNSESKMVCGSFPYLGLLMAVISSVFFSVCSLIVKLMDQVDPLQLAAIRFIGILLPTIVIVIYTRESPFGPPEKRLLLFLRAVLGAINLMMQFYAIRHMPLADASVVIFSCPVFVVIFARIFLKEPCGIFNVIVIILTLLGVVLITKPPFLFGDSVYEHGYTTDMLRGGLVAFVSIIFKGNVYVLVRCLKDIHYSVILLNFAFVAIIMAFLACYFFGSLVWLSGTDWYLAVTLAVFSFAGQFLLTKSLQHEQAGPVAICRTADIVFAFAWQILFFHDVFNWFSVGGEVLIVFSVVLTGVQKWLLNLPVESPWKEKFKFLTCDQLN